MCQRQVDSQIVQSLAKLSHLKSFLHAVLIITALEWVNSNLDLKCYIESYVERKVSCFVMHPLKAAIFRAQTRDEIRRVPGAT